MWGGILPSRNILIENQESANKKKDKLISHLTREVIALKPFKLLSFILQDKELVERGNKLNNNMTSISSNPQLHIKVVSMCVCLLAGCEQLWRSFKCFVDFHFCLLQD